MASFVVQSTGIEDLHVLGSPLHALETRRDIELGIAVAARRRLIATVVGSKHEANQADRPYRRCARVLPLRGTTCVLIPALNFPSWQGNNCNMQQESSTSDSWPSPTPTAAAATSLHRLQLVDD